MNSASRRSEESRTPGDAASLPAMTELQESLTAAGGSPLRRYQDLFVGSRRPLDLLRYELVTTFLLPLPGAIGYYLRSRCLRFVLGGAGAGAAIGRQLTLRNPRAIRLGRGVVIDDFVTLDAKGSRSSIEIGDRVMIGRGTILVTTDGTLAIGDGSNVGSNCRIATRLRLTLGRSVLVAANCYIGASNHHFERTDVPVIAQGLDIEGREIEIEDNVWIGTGATILYGVRIGHDAIVGAHSLVNVDVPPYAIAAGTPARVLRMRDPAVPPNANP